MVFYHPMKAGTFTVSSGFGTRWGSQHLGVDFAAPTGTPIYAPADGLVVEGKDRAQGSVSGFGSWIWIDSQTACGKDFIFGHVDHSGILVRSGDRVRAGQQIGVVGNEGQSTGPHLHFEVWVSPGRLGGSTIDPAGWLERAKVADPPSAAPKQAASSSTTTAAVASSAVARYALSNPPQITDISQSFGFGYARSLSDIQAIFIHTTENPTSAKAINVGRWQAGGKSSGNVGMGSYHVLVDRTELVRCNTDGWVAYGTSNRGNQVGLQLSFVAQARMSRAQWLAEETQHGTLSRGAWQAADWCKRHNIPVIHLDTAALRAGRKGISTHNGARLAWGITDHTDPGAGFPMDVFLDLTRKAMTMTQPTTSAAAAGSVKSDLEALLGDKAYQSLVPGSSARLSILDILRLGDRYDYEAAGTLAEITKRLERIEATLDRVESMTKGL